MYSGNGKCDWRDGKHTSELSCYAHNAMTQNDEGIHVLVRNTDLKYDSNDTAIFPLILE